jgi:hypothetical protein
MTESALVRALRAGLRRIPGIVESPGTFYDDDAYWMNAKEIAHLQGDNAVEIRLTRKVISAHHGELKADPRVALRGSSDWLTFTFASKADVTRALQLAALGAEAHRPPNGQAAPPPTGAALERRRRFH